MLVRNFSQGLREIGDGAPQGAARRDAWRDLHTIATMVCGVCEQQSQQWEEETLKERSTAASGLAKASEGIPDEPTFQLVHALRPLLDDLKPGDFLRSAFGNDIMMQA